MATSPVFAVTPRIGIATLVSATAVTSRANITGTTGLVSLITGAATGTRVDRILIKGTETTAAGCYGIWLYNGTTSYLLREVTATAITAGNTTASFEAEITFGNLILPSASFALYVSSTIDQDATIVAIGADL